ncbi:MAG: hypothetical protein DRP09_20080 [Candidatus Thorarchaeota archaeon]|nr:MAG: hypothetical protein DRP09_20080 [Candidatus Thorarchaeota archaeon]
MQIVKRHYTYDRPSDFAERLAWWKALFAGYPEEVKLDYEHSWLKEVDYWKVGLKPLAWALRDVRKRWSEDSRPFELMLCLCDVRPIARRLQKVANK